MNNIEALENKILTPKSAHAIINSMQLLGKKIVFTNGCFDILHKGHLDYLAKTRDKGDFLVVGLNSDYSIKRLKGDKRPIQDESSRAYHLASLFFVDAVVIFEEDTPFELISLLKPNILIKGGDYSIENIIGADIVKKNGGIVEILPFLEGYSTTKIINKIIQIENE